MKKIAIFVFSILCLVQSTKAQEGFKFGLKISPLISIAKWDSSKTVIESISAKSRIGFSGGLMVGYGFSEAVSVQSGILVTMPGFTQELKVGSQTYTNKFGLSLVEVPVFLKMRTNDLGSGIHAKGQFGGALGLKVGGKVNASEDIIIYPKGKSTISNHFQPLNAWFVFGGGVDWELEGIGTLDLGLSFHYGLNNVLRQKIDVTRAGFTFNDVYKDQRARLSWLALDIGFWF